MGYDSLEHFEEAYQGEYDSERDFSDNLADEIYNTDKHNYFDYNSFCDDKFMHDYTYLDRYVFSNI